MKHSEETKNKISNSLIGHKVSDDTKKRISETLRNKPVLKDETIIGIKKNRLTIIEELDRRIKPCGQKQRVVKCKCDCGNETIVILNLFINDKVKSCGCLKKESLRDIATKHGLSSQKIYRVYRGIKNRCYNKNHKDYKDYGARGIEMCSEWKEDFMSFYTWAINNGYNPNKTIKEQSIDRIDVNKNYEPSNCRFVDCYKQSRNKRNTKRYMFNGELLDLKTISDIVGINYNRLWQRINKYGYSFEEALL